MAANKEPVPCEPTTKIPVKGWVKQRETKMGEKSARGLVYQACNDWKNCNYVMKIQNGPQAVSRTIQEVKMQESCAAKGLCMPVRDYWVCEKQQQGVIVTPMLCDTLHSRLKETSDKKEGERLVQKALDLLVKLHKNGLSHGDAHINNFMFKCGMDELVFIDIQTGEDLRSMNASLRDMKVLLDYGEFKNSLEGRHHPGHDIYNDISNKIGDAHRKLMDSYNKSQDEKLIFEGLLAKKEEADDIFSRFASLQMMKEPKEKDISEYLEGIDLEDLDFGDLDLSPPTRDGDERIDATCRPEKDNPNMKQDCDFAWQRMYSPKEAKENGIIPYTHKSKNEEQLFEDYLNEFSVFVLKKGTVLVHATNRENVLDYRNMGWKINEECWWRSFYPGQKSYGGGWFTYNTRYGGPEYFGMFLYYKLQKDVPVLYIPDYTSRINDPEYIDPDPDTRYNIHKYSGSHIIQGPKGWKQKGYKSVREGTDYFADGIAKTLSRLGFNGYISCDECEVYLSHAVMTGALTCPYRLDFNGDNLDEDINHQGVHGFKNQVKYIVDHCLKQKCDLKVTQVKTRKFKKPQWLTVEESLD